MHINDTAALKASQQNIKNDLPMKATPSIWLSKRFFVVATLFVGFSNSVMLSCNIDISIIEMTSSSLLTSDNITAIRSPEFQWDRSTIGVVSSMHSYAGLFPFLGSYFANKFGGSTSSSLCLIMAGILTILHQIILYINFHLFLVCRILVGLSTTSYFVSTAEIFSKWFPKKERTTLISFCYSGASIGVIIAYPLYGYIANQYGWHVVFYVSGITSIIVALLILTIVKDRPSQDKWISKEELLYILEETNTTTHKKVTQPYSKILSSGPVLALCIGRFGFMWMDNLLVESLPLYVKDITQSTTAETGLISAIPVICPIITYPLSGMMLDYWKNHTNMTLTLIHKITITVAFLTSSFLLIEAILISDFITSITIFVFVKIIQSTAAPVFDLLTVNIAPNDATKIAAILSVTMSGSSVISRTVAGLLTMNHTLDQWNDCFLLSSVLLVLATLVFLKFGSSEAQPWSLPKDEEEKRYLMGNTDQFP